MEIDIPGSNVSEWKFHGNQRNIQLQMQRGGLHVGQDEEWKTKGGGNGKREGNRMQGIGLEREQYPSFGSGSNVYVHQRGRQKVNQAENQMGKNFFYPSSGPLGNQNFNQNKNQHSSQRSWNQGINMFNQIGNQKQIQNRNQMSNMSGLQVENQKVKQYPYPKANVALGVQNIQQRGSNATLRNLEYPTRVGAPTQSLMQNRSGNQIGANLNQKQPSQPFAFDRRTPATKPFGGFSGQDVIKMPIIPYPASVKYPQIPFKSTFPPTVSSNNRVVSKPFNDMSNAFTDDPSDFRSPNALPKSNRKCRDFLQGNCERGINCAFSHDLSTNTTGNLDYSGQANANQPEVCYYFLKGACSKGDQCKYFHPKSNSVLPTMKLSNPESVKKFPRPTPPSISVAATHAFGTTIQSAFSSNLATASYENDVEMEDVSVASNFSEPVHANFQSNSLDAYGYSEDFYGNSQQVVEQNENFAHGSEDDSLQPKNDSMQVNHLSKKALQVLPKSILKPSSQNSAMKKNVRTFPKEQTRSVEKVQNALVDVKENSSVMQNFESASTSISSSQEKNEDFVLSVRGFDPQENNIESRLQKHFGKFGQLTRLNIKNKLCYVTFGKEADAINAKNKGSRFDAVSLKIVFVSKNLKKPKVATDYIEDAEKVDVELPKLTEKRFPKFPRSAAVAATSIRKSVDVDKKNNVSVDVQGYETEEDKRLVPAQNSTPSAPRIRIEDLKKRALEKHLSMTNSQSQAQILPLDSLHTSVEHPKPTFLKSSIASTSFESDNHNFQSGSQVDESDADGDFVGECMMMCSEEERLDREIHRELSEFEILPGTEHNIAPEYPLSSPDLCIAKFKRSAAGGPKPPRSKIRPPEILQQVMHHLLDNVVDSNANTDLSFLSIYKFMRDRFRAVRQDLTYQRTLFFEDISIEIHEQQFRFFLWAGLELCDVDDAAEFDPKQHNEAMSQCLTSLLHCYQDKGRKGQICLHEAEFQGYQILMNITDAEALTHVPVVLMNSPEIQFALQSYAAFHEKNYVRFFYLVQQATILQACALHRLFPMVREIAMQTIVKSFNKTLLPLQELQEWLLFDDIDQTFDFCQFYGVDHAIEETYLNFMGNLSIIKPARPPIYSSNFILEMGANFSRADIIRSLTSIRDNNNQKADFLEQSEEIEEIEEIKEKLEEEDIISAHLAPAQHVPSLNLEMKQSSIELISPSFAIGAPNIFQVPQSAAASSNGSPYASEMPLFFPNLATTAPASYRSSMMTQSLFFGDAKDAHLSPANISRSQALDVPETEFFGAKSEYGNESETGDNHVAPLHNLTDFALAQANYLNQNVIALDQDAALQHDSVRLNDQEPETNDWNTSVQVYEPESVPINFSEPDAFGISPATAAMTSAQTRLTLLGKFGPTKRGMNLYSLVDPIMRRCPAIFSTPLNLSALLISYVSRQRVKDVIFTAIVSLPDVFMESLNSMALETNGDFQKVLNDNGSPFVDDCSSASCWLLLKLSRGNLSNMHFVLPNFKPISSYVQDVTSDALLNADVRNLLVDIHLHLDHSQETPVGLLKGLQTVFFLCTRVITTVDIQCIMEQRPVNDLFVSAGDISRLAACISSLHVDSNVVFSIYYHLAAAAQAYLSSLSLELSRDIISTFNRSIKSKFLTSLKNLFDFTSVGDEIFLVCPLHAPIASLFENELSNDENYLQQPSDICLNHSIVELAGILADQRDVYEIEISEILNGVPFLPSCFEFLRLQHGEAGDAASHLDDWIFHFNSSVSAIAATLGEYAWPDISWPPIFSNQSLLPNDWNEASNLLRYSHFLSSILLPTDASVLKIAPENNLVLLDFVSSISPISIEWPPAAVLSEEIIELKNELVHYLSRSTESLTNMEWISVMEKIITTRLAELRNFQSTAEFEVDGCFYPFKLYSHVSMDSFINHAHAQGIKNIGRVRKQVDHDTDLVLIESKKKKVESSFMNGVATQVVEEKAFLAKMENRLSLLEKTLAEFGP